MAMTKKEQAAMKEAIGRSRAPPRYRSNTAKGLTMTDEKIIIAGLSESNELLDFIYENTTSAEGVSDRLIAYARAIESAATAPLLERIEQLEALVKTLEMQSSASIKALNERGARIAELERSLEFAEAVAAADNTLHHAINVAQAKVVELEAKLAQQADPMSRIAKSKLADLIADGYRECGVMIERPGDDGAVKRGAVSNGGMVIWWHPAQQADAQEPFAWAHVCRKKPELRVLSFSKNDPSLAALGYKDEPLFTRPQPAQLQRLSEEETMAAWRGVDDAGDDRRNAMLYGDAIQSALAAKNGAELK